MERQNAEEVDLAVKAKTINWNYTKSLAGFVKLLLILAQIGNWWSIAVSPVSINGTVTMNVSTVAIRDATLFFSLSGLVHSVALYSLNLFNVSNISKFSFYKFPSLLIVRIIFFQKVYLIIFYANLYKKVFLSEKSHFISSSVLASFAWNELQKLSKTGSYDPFSGSTVSELFIKKIKSFRLLISTGMNSYCKGFRLWCRIFSYN
jgi:hypothetical protein